jgi:hypothetical protein
MLTTPIVKDAMIQNVWLDPSVGLDVSNLITNSYKVGVVEQELLFVKN